MGSCPVDEFLAVRTLGRGKRVCSVGSPVKLKSRHCSWIETSSSASDKVGSDIAGGLGKFCVLEKICNCIAWI